MSHSFPISRLLLGYFQEVRQRIGQILYLAQRETKNSEKEIENSDSLISLPGHFYYMPFEDITNELPENSFFFNLQCNFLFNSIYQGSVFNNFHIGFQIFQIKYS